MATYLILSTLFTGLMSALWNTKGWFNVSIKLLFTATAFTSAFYAAQMLGYIVKVQYAI